jgi:hypothetical protein
LSLLKNYFVPGVLDGGNLDMKMNLQNGTSVHYIDGMPLNVPGRLITWNSSCPHDNLPQGRRRLPFPEHTMDNKHEN